MIIESNEASERGEEDLLLQDYNNSNDGANNNGINNNATVPIHADNNAGTQLIGHGTSIAGLIQSYDRMNDKEYHFSLRNALTLHLWNKKGDSL